jgi:hypothetical protein
VSLKEDLNRLMNMTPEKPAQRSRARQATLVPEDDLYALMRLRIASFGSQKGYADYLGYDEAQISRMVAKKQRVGRIVLVDIISHLTKHQE